MDKLFELLESTETGVVEEVKSLIDEQLRLSRSGEADAVWLFNALLDYYLISKSKRTLLILTGIRDLYADHLLHRLSERLGRVSCRDLAIGDNRVESGDEDDEANLADSRVDHLVLLSHIVCNNPPWVARIPRHPIMTKLIQLAMTEENPAALMCGILCISLLVPLAPLEITTRVKDLFACFARVARWLASRPSHVTEIVALQLYAALTALFHRLYALFPCNFLEFLRRRFGPVAMTSMSPTDPNNVFNPQGVFNMVILPMLSSVRLHHLFITASSQTEINPSRWRKKEAHDVLMDISKVTLDPTDAASQGLAAEFIETYLSSSSFRFSIVKSSKTVITKTESASVSARRFSSTDSSTSPRKNHGADNSVVGAKSSIADFRVRKESTIAADLDWNPAIVCGLATPPPPDASPAFANQETAPALTTTESIPVPVKDALLPSQASTDKTDQATNFVVVERAKSLVEGPPRRIIPSMSAPEMSALPSLADLEIIVKEMGDGDGEEGDDLDQEVSELVGVERMGEGFDKTTDDLTGGEVGLDPYPFPENDKTLEPEADAETCKYSAGSSVESESVINFMKNINRLRFNSISSELRGSSTSPLSGGPLKYVRSCPLLLEEVESESGGGGSGGGVVSRVVDEDPGPRRDRCATCGRREKDSEGDEDARPTTPPLRASNLLDHVWPYLRLPSDSDNDAGEKNDAAYPDADDAEEVLKKHMKLGAEVHMGDLWKRMPLVAQADTNWTHFGGHPPPDEVKILKTRLNLAENRMLFERQKRQLHAKRNRHLLGRVVKAMALEEKNSAMKDQLQLQETEMSKLRESLVATQSDHAAKCSKLADQLQSLSRDVEQRMRNEAKSAKIRVDLESALAAAQAELVEKRAECDRLKQTQFELNENAKGLEAEAGKVPVLQAELNRANDELILHGELQMKYQQKLNLLEERFAEPSFEMEAKLAAMRYDATNLKSSLDSLTVTYEATRARLLELEKLLVTRDAAIEDLKFELDQEKAYRAEAVEAMERRYQTSLRVNQSLEGAILQLKAFVKLESPRTPPWASRQKKKKNGLDRAAVQDLRSLPSFPSLELPEALGNESKGSLSPSGRPLSRPSLNDCTPAGLAPIHERSGWTSSEGSVQDPRWDASLGSPISMERIEDEDEDGANNSLGENDSEKGINHECE